MQRPSASHVVNPGNLTVLKMKNEKRVNNKRKVVKARRKGMLNAIRLSRITNMAYKKSRNNTGETKSLTNCV